MGKCYHATHTHFQLIPSAAGPPIYRLLLLSSFRTHPFRTIQREREQAFLDFIRQEEAGSILRSQTSTAYVPVYDSNELESWTAHLDMVSRAGIHQT
eukprot:3941048-Rhodomonas_salina.2